MFISAVSKKGDGLGYCHEINLEPMEHRHQAFFHTEKIVSLSKLTSLQKIQMAVAPFFLTNCKSRGGLAISTSRKW